MSSTPPGRGRVIESHHIARTAFVAALAFALVAVAWSVYVLALGGSWWGPMHAFLAGTALLAISGASQLFTITWSTTTPPPPGRVLTQRWLIIVGVACVLVGVTFDLSAPVWFGGAAAAAGVALLGEIIYSAIRKSLLRRFDLSARFYLAAFVSGVVGISLGTLMGAGSDLGTSPSIRLVHAHLNLVGLVGLTIIGTIPTLLPTTAYSRAVSGREALVGWWMSLAGAVSIAIGLWLPNLVGSGVLLIALAAATILAGIIWRLWEKGKHKLTFLQITIGTLWLVGWGFVDGIRVMIDGVMTPFSGWTGAVVVAGVGQVLAGSLAYLVPVLGGSPFETNRQLMEERPWLPLLALNAAGVGLTAGLSTAPAILTAVWLVDFAGRLARLAKGRPRHTTPEHS